MSDMNEYTRSCNARKNDIDHNWSFCETATLGTVTKLPSGQLQPENKRV